MRSYPIIDADTHLSVPMDEVEQRVPSALRIDRPKTPDGKRMLLVNCVGLSPVEWRLFAEGDQEKRMRAGAWDPAARIADMDTDYVDVHVLYGGVPIVSKDRDTQIAYVRAYNDWVAEFCTHAPDRLFTNACIPYTGIDDALAEVKRARDLPGIRGIILDAWPNGSKRWPRHDDEDRFWSLLEDLDLPVVVHVGFGVEGEADENMLEIMNTPGLGLAWLNSERLAVETLPIVNHFVLGGILDRHPRLRFGCIETGIGWIPFYLEQTEDCYSRHRFWTNTRLALPPSELWERQCFATFQVDRFGVRNRHDAGVGTLLWSSDYPHSGADWPFSRKSIALGLDGVPEEEQRRILCDNAARLWGLETTKLGRVTGS